MLLLQCYDLKVSLNLVSMEFVAVSDKYIFLFYPFFLVFAAENAAVHDGIVVEKFVSLCCNLGHSLFSSFQCRNHTNRPITEQMFIFSDKTLSPTVTPPNLFCWRLVQ